MNIHYLKSTIDNIPFVAWVKDLNGVFIHVNKHYEQNCGKNYNDIIGKTDYDIFPREEAKKYELHDKRIITNKQKHQFIDFNNGHWYETHKSPVLDDSNNVVGITGFTRDITHEKELDETLKDEKQLFQVLLDNIPYTIYFKDKNSKFLKINKAQAETLGLDSPEMAIGKSDFDFFTQDHAKLAFDDEKKIIQTGKPIINKVERIRHANGKYKWVSTTKMPIEKNNGDIVGIVGLTIDITDKIEVEQKLKGAKEKAEESDRLKTAFLANMSHEIRTPMNGIIGFSNLLKDPSINEKERHEYLDLINDCGQNLLHLIDDIIDISKIESGQLKINISSCLINIILNELKITTAEILKLENKENIKLIINTDNNDPSYNINTDPHRFKQIMYNLLNNAVKFTMNGSIEFGYYSKDANHLVFYIKDTGTGIPKEKQKYIFERFGQVVHSNYSNQKGTGLGLAISKELVQLLGGHIWVESEINKGSVFYFTLPVDKTY